MKKSRKYLSLFLTALALTSVVLPNTSVNNSNVAYAATQEDKALGWHSVSFTSTKHWDGKMYGYMAKVNVNLEIRKTSSKGYYITSYNSSTPILTPKLQSETITYKNYKATKTDKYTYKVEADLNVKVPGQYSGTSCLRVYFKVNPNTGAITAYEK